MLVRCVRHTGDNGGERSQCGRWIQDVKNLFLPLHTITRKFYRPPPFLYPCHPSLNILFIYIYIYRYHIGEASNKDSVENFKGGNLLSLSLSLSLSRYL